MIRKLLAMTCGALFSAAAFAGPLIEVDYLNLQLDFNSTTSVLSLGHRSNSVLSAFAKDASDTIIDEAAIFNIISANDFELAFSGVVNNGGGLNDLSIGASFAATDTVTTLAAPSLAAMFANANLTGDLDGISFGNGVLRIEGVISATGPWDSILANPTPDWVFVGDPVGTAPGLDSVADQITIGSAIRGDYQTGILAILEITLGKFADGTSTAGLNADQLFEQALLHGGFTSSDAQLQLNVIPEPGAALLGLLGLSGLAWLRRRS